MFLIPVSVCVRIYCNYCLSNTRRSFSTEQISSHSFPSLQHRMGLSWPKCMTWHFALLNLTQFATAHWSSLSRPLLPILQQINIPTQAGAVHRSLRQSWSPGRHSVITADAKMNWTAASKNSTLQFLPHPSNFLNSSFQQCPAVSYM